MLAAGLKGIENRYEFPPAAQSNALYMSQAERDELGIEALPANLWEAIQISERSELVHDSLGEPVFKSFIENKKIEWENYHSRVADYETEHYLPVL
jgi:glutamine synthetase